MSLVRGKEGGADSREFLKQVFFFKGLRGRNRRKKTKGLIVRRMRGWPAGGNVAQSGPPGEARTLTDVRWHDAASQILHY